MNAVIPIKPSTPEPQEAMETRRLPQAASTWNAETWTVEAVIATSGAGSAVTRYDERGEYLSLIHI